MELFVQSLSEATRKTLLGRGFGHVLNPYPTRPRQPGDYFLIEVRKRMKRREIKEFLVSALPWGRCVFLVITRSPADRQRYVRMVKRFEAEAEVFTNLDDFAAWVVTQRFRKQRNFTDNILQLGREQGGANEPTTEDFHRSYQDGEAEDH